MKAGTLIVTSGLALAGVFLSTCHLAAQSSPERVVRLAELEIDPAQIDAYKAFLKEEIEASIRVEPGVLTLYAVTLKEQTNQVRLFEMYASPAAYQAHINSEHFRKYKTATASMVKSLRLMETEPLMLGAK